MPTFGEYDTIGEPLATTEAHGEVTTVWMARKSEGDAGPFYAIKCYKPRGSDRNRGQPGDALEEDKALGFLDAIKELHEAGRKGGRCLARIHGFGMAPEGAWYATDYCESKTLKEFINGRGDVDDKILRHVVHSVAVACLALRQSRALRCAHGNLKPGNVLLVGKSQWLGKRPLRITDPLSASAQLGKLGSDNRQTVGELFANGVEVQDLHAIGRLVVQLIEGRLAREDDELIYPVAPSERWNRLGKARESWVQVCDRLLNPNLQIENENLEKLEREFRPNLIISRAPLILTVLLGLCLAGGGAKYASHILKLREEARRARLQALGDEFKRAFEAGNQSLEETNYVEAAEKFSQAIEVAAAQGNVTNKDLAANGQRFAEAVTRAKQAQEDERLEDEIQWLNAALTNRPDQRIKSRLADARSRRNRAAVQAAMKLGMDMLGEAKAWQTNFATVEAQFQKAADLGRELPAQETNAADAGRRFAKALKDASLARPVNENVDQEIVSLESARRVARETRSIKLPDVSAWVDDARQRKQKYEEGKLASQITVEKRAGMLNAISLGKKLLAEAKYGQAANEFDKAARNASDLADVTNRNVATLGRDFADLLDAADKAKSKGSLNDEIARLAEAQGLKEKHHQTWLPDLDARLHAANESRKEKISQVTAAITSAEQQLLETNYSHAMDDFVKGAKAAEVLEDVTNRNLALNGKLFADDLAKAETARKNGLVDEEIERLNGAQRIRKETAGLKLPDVDAWLAGATKQRDQARHEKDIRGKMADAMNHGKSLLGEARSSNTNYVLAATEFQRAAVLGQEIHAPETNAAIGGKLYADRLEQARVARQKSDAKNERVSLLAAAEIAKAHPEARLPGVDAWLAEIKEPSPPPKETPVSPPRENPVLALSRPGTNIFGVDFVWVRKGEAGAGGWMCVEASELSGGVCSNLCNRFHIPFTPGYYYGSKPENAGRPAIFRDFKDATDFLAALNSASGEKGSFRLPSMAEYRSFVDNHDKLNAADLESLKKVEYIAIGVQLGANPPREVVPGPSDQLKDVVGNVVEWTSDGEKFGVSYLIGERDFAKGVNLSEPKSVPKEPIGLRLVFEPSAGGR